MNLEEINDGWYWALVEEIEEVVYLSTNGFVEIVGYEGQIPKEAVKKWIKKVHKPTKLEVTNGLLN